MSLITDLLSKVNQTAPLKNIPPGLTNSINTYKKKETNKKRAIFFSVVIFASLVSGFAAIYAAKLLLGGGAVPVCARGAGHHRPPGITRSHSYGRRPQ